MFLPFRLRLAFCAMSACALSACGGGGDTSALSSTSARDSVDVESFGAYEIGYLTYYSDAVELNVGYLKGNKQKFVVGIEKPGDSKTYECISSAWTNADKAALLAQYGVVPATCDDSQITLDASTDQFSMVRAVVPSASGGEIVLSLTKKLLPIFPG